MATSSITKNFVVRDVKAYKKLLKEIEKKPVRSKTLQSSNIQRGQELLNQFSFR